MAPQPRRRVYAQGRRFCISLISGAGGRHWPAILPAFLPAGNSRFRLTRTTVAPSPDQRDPGRRSVSSAPLRIASRLPLTGRKVSRSVSARAFPAHDPPSGNVCFKSLAALFWAFHTLARAAGKTTHYRQAKMNSRNLTNITTPFTHRQRSFAASHEQTGFRWDR
jgi:hypothetical protein